MDFFSDVSSLQTLDSVGPDRSPVRAETARDVGAMDQASGSKSNVAAKSDVLEQAYHAAMALSATPTAPANVASPADGAAAQIHLPQESRLDSESMLQEAAATVDASGLIAAQEQAKRAEYSSQEAEYGAVAEEAGKAVEAEGLIWVDDTQTTAYSVRCVGKTSFCALRLLQYYHAMCLKVLLTPLVVVPLMSAPYLL